MMKIAAVATTILALFAMRAECAELEIGKIYRLEVAATDLKSAGNSATTASASKYSTFSVVEKLEDGTYAIRFETLYSYGEIASSVEKDTLYVLPEKLQGAAITSVTSQTYSGLVSGPLVIPFKYRFDDSSLAGDATLGYYAGYGFSVPVGRTYRVPFTPFVSAGISQVSTDINGESESRSAFTWSAGIIVRNWDNVNIGLVYGQDRVGDSRWTHEGEGWAAVMIGWELK